MWPWIFYIPQCFKKIEVDSNRYAKEMMDPEKYESRKPIDEADLKAFFGFTILMGLNQLPSIQDYRKQSPVYHYSPIADEGAIGRSVAICTLLTTQHWPHQYLWSMIVWEKCP